MKTAFQAATFSLTLICLQAVAAEPPPANRQRVIICLVTLEHADAEQLVEVLAPFLSPHGKIVAYPPSNTLIIKDHPSVVEMLVKVIKGRPDLSECQSSKNPTPEGLDGLLP